MKTDYIANTGKLSLAELQTLYQVRGGSLAKVLITYHKQNFQMLYLPTQVTYLDWVCEKKIAAL